MEAGSWTAQLFSAAEVPADAPIAFRARAFDEPKFFLSVRDPWGPIRRTGSATRANSEL
jgi:hypothetical protein